MSKYKLVGVDVLRVGEKVFKHGEVAELSDDVVKSLRSGDVVPAETESKSAPSVRSFKREE